MGSEERRSSIGMGSAGAIDQSERIQAYTNNALTGSLGSAMRTKLNKLRHPSTQRGDEGPTPIKI